MRLWELVSAFRSESNLLESVFAERGDQVLSAHLQNFSELVDSQNREVLDSVVPDELVLLVASRSSQEFVLSEGGTLRAPLIGHDGELLSAVDVVRRFGGSVIEEVREYGSANVADETP